jgi:NAD(P)-dependent dehydrogenase (short-subunit alcohol dehydrogenase family)
LEPVLEGRVAVVIGGHSGFGLAISRRFIAAGAQVLIAARRADVLSSIADEIGADWTLCDITDDTQVAALAAHTLDRFGTVDIAVNCAGFEQSTPLADLTPERLLPMQAVQLTGALYAMRHLGNALAASGGGAYLNLSSLTAQNPAVGLTAYASAKAGIEYATKIAAVEYGDQAVRFNAIAAGLIETPMTARVFSFPVAIEAVRELTPLGRMGHPDDIAAAALFLCSDDAAFITGQTLCVDGGASLLALPTAQIRADVARRWAEASGDPT